jgi:hypothetical protein
MRRILLPTVLVIAALSLAGCSSSSGSAASSSLDSEAGHAPVAQSQAASGTSGGSTSNAADIIPQRQVITTGTVTITTKDPISAGDTAAHIAEAAGGRVDDRSQNAATKHRGGTATLTLRIPATALTAALDQLKKLGHVQTVKLTAEDVTQKSEDLNARIKALATSVDRLLKLESKATSTTTLIQLEDDIAQRQGDLESLTAQQRYLSDQVAMSTIHLELTSPALPAAKAKTPTPGSAAGAGFAGFGLFFTWVFLVLSYLLPWLLLGAVVAAAIVFIVRWRRRRGQVAPVVTPGA